MGNGIDYIGAPVLLFGPCNTDMSSAALASSDLLTGVSIKGMDNILFLIAHGAVVGEGGDYSFQVQYSSTGSASDAASSAAAWTCTDAILTFTTAVCGAAGVYTILFDVSAKGLSDAAGRLFGIWTGSSAARQDIEILAIPFPATATLPLDTADVTADD